MSNKATADAGTAWSIDEVSSSVVLLDRTGKITAISEAARHLLGQGGVRGLCKKDFADFLDGENVKDLTDALETTAQTGRPVGVELNLPGNGSEALHASASLVKIAPDNGEGIFQLHIDTAALTAPSPLTQRLLFGTKAAGIAVWEHDLAADIIRWDENFCKIYGLPDDRLTGNYGDWRQMVHPDDVEQMEEDFRASFTNGGTFEGVFRIVRVDGAERSLKAFTQILFGDDGEPRMVVGINYDITEQVNAETRALEAAENLRQAQRRLTLLGQNAPGAMFEYREDADGTPSYPYYSAKFPEMLGVVGADSPISVEDTFDKVHPDDMQNLIDAIAASRQNLETFTVRYRINHPVVGERWVLATSEPKAQPDGAIIWFGFLLDITDYRRSEERAAAAVEERNAANARLSSVANVVPVGIYEMGRTSDGQSFFPYCNDYFLDMAGLTREEIMKDDKVAYSKIFEDDVAGFRRDLDHSAKTLQPFIKRFRLYNPLGGISWMSIVSEVHKTPEGDIYWTGAMIDVSADVAREEALQEARKRAERIQAENEWQAHHDGLTGLPNRRFFDRTFADRLELAAGGGTNDALLVRIDLDHFKHVNDTLGHEAGDHVLIHVARALTECFRGGDFVARVGGDEFSVLMEPGTSEKDAQAIVERARKALSEPVLYNDRPCRFGSSFGIAHTATLAQTADDLHLFADAALYRAKELGRNRVEAYTPSLHREISKHRTIAEELHNALDDNQLEPYFQPQIYSDTGELAGVEVLLRWNHPRDGVLSPGAFMGVAEQLKIVGDIDRIVMEKCHQALKRLGKLGIVPPKVSLNVSASRMHDPNVIDLARQMASPETRVAFELLESILVEEESDVFRFHLDQIREAGIEIEIDDFGSGHASILSVMESQATSLKIDQRLIKPLPHDERAQKLVRAIIEIADTLGIGTVAEGVEVAEHVDILRDLGCDVLQGYLFSRPVDEVGFQDFVMGRQGHFAATG